MLEWILVCKRCGHAERVGIRPTAGAGCPGCFNYRCMDLVQAVTVDAVVAPANYVWTPWLSTRT